MNISLCKNQYFLKEIARKYFTKSPERYYPYNDILQRLDEYNSVKNEEDLLELASVNGYDGIIYYFIEKDANFKLALNYYEKLFSATPNIRELDLINFFSYLDENLIDSDQLADLFDTVRKNRSYQVLDYLIRNPIINKLDYDIFGQVRNAIIWDDETALRTILDVYGPMELGDINIIYDIIIDKHPDMVQIFIDYGFFLPDNLIIDVVKSKKMKGNRLAYLMNIWEHTKPKRKINEEALVDAIIAHKKEYRSLPAKKWDIIDNLNIIDFLSKKVDLSEENLLFDIANHTDVDTIEILTNNGLKIDDKFLLEVAERGKKRVAKYLLNNYKFPPGIIEKVEKILWNRKE